MLDCVLRQQNNNRTRAMIKTARISALPLTALLLLNACEQGPQYEGPAPYSSRYQPLPAVATLLRGATVLTGTGERLDDADVAMDGGRIVAVGQNLDAAGMLVVDARGKWITPGVIDVHSHLGVYASPRVDAHSDGNEMTAPNTAEVWAEHAVWPQDPGFVAALAGGVTSLQILPGSANLFGGRGVTLKNVPGQSVQEMKFPGAPHGLKMACGENPKRVYGSKGQAPLTRMGNVAGYRSAWIDAEDYRKKKAAAEKGQGEAPKRDLKLETLAGVLDGEILVHNHCYRADEMAVMLDVAKEFSYKITAFHHGVEAYKVADLLRENDTCAAIWADWYGFKMESFDGIRENAAILDRAGACTVMHSDSEIGIQRLNQESAKVMGAAARAGIDIAPERAVRWFTSNAAKALGIDEVTGTLEPGKMADVTVWSGNPFSVYTLAERVYIDGALVYERGNDEINPVTDFSLGTSALHGGPQ
ncbi:MAG: amidohydrolase family protein [Woeseiaceae bacterium]|nr:amidohydrolase family protein [Woeseiaceae bacterium]